MFKFLNRKLIKIEKETNYNRKLLTLQCTSTISILVLTLFGVSFFLFPLTTIKRQDVKYFIQETVTA